MPVYSMPLTNFQCFRDSEKVKISTQSIDTSQRTWRKKSSRQFVIAKISGSARTRSRKNNENLRRNQSWKSRGTSQHLRHLSRRRVQRLVRTTVISRHSAAAVPKLKTSSRCRKVRAGVNSAPMVQTLPSICAQVIASSTTTKKATSAPSETSSTASTCSNDD